jgi:hypothetical protein
MMLGKLKSCPTDAQIYILIAIESCPKLAD